MHLNKSFLADVDERVVEVVVVDPVTVLQGAGAGLVRDDGGGVGGGAVLQSEVSTEVSRPITAHLYTT